MLESKSSIKVSVENTRITVAGRVYEAAHVIVLGAQKLSLIVENEGVRVNAEFDKLPETRPNEGDTLRIARPGRRYEAPPGESDIYIRKEGNVMTAVGKGLVIKFESDNLRVTAKIQDKEKFTGKRLKIESSVEGVLNVMSSPFVIGVLYFPERVESTAVIKDDVITIKVVKSD